MPLCHLRQSCARGQSTLSGLRHFAVRIRGGSERVVSDHGDHRVQCAELEQYWDLHPYVTDHFLNEVDSSRKNDTIPFPDVSPDSNSASTNGSIKSRAAFPTPSATLPKSTPLQLPRAHTPLQSRASSSLRHLRSTRRLPPFPAHSPPRVGLLTRGGGIRLRQRRVGEEIHQG